MNEYLAEYRSLFGDSYSGGFDYSRGFEHSIKAFATRERLVRGYAHAVPDDRALELIAGYAPLVEIGAGGGYWAMLLRELGTDVIAYDIDQSSCSDRIWSEVLIGDETTAARHPDRTLFLCWPPYDTPMGYRTLRNYLRAGGERLVYIGEGPGGCTGSAGMFRLMRQRMRRVGDYSIPRWPGIHDYLQVYERDHSRNPRKERDDG